jgi:hypothetical protein
MPKKNKNKKINVSKNVKPHDAPTWVSDAYVRDVVIPQLAETFDAVTRDISDSTDSSKVRQFKIMSEILSQGYTDYSNFTHRTKVEYLSGLAKFLIRKIAEDAIIDGWALIRNEERQYEESEEEDIKNRYKHILETLESLQYDTINDILTRIIELKRRDQFGAIFPIFETTVVKDTVTDNGTIDQETTQDLKRIQIFPENDISITSSDLDDMGYPETVNLTIHLAKKQDTRKFNIEEQKIILFSGPRKDRESMWVGQSVLENIWYYVLYLEWTAFSGTDFVNNRGSFLWLKRLLTAGTITKLQDLHTTLNYVFTRNAMVTDSNYELQQMGAGGTGIPIGEIKEMLYELLSTSSGVPTSKLKGAQKGLRSAAKEDRIDYFPVLKAEQRFLEPIFRKMIEWIDPLFFTDYELRVEFKLVINLSDLEKEELLTKELGNIQSWIDILAALGYKIGEMIEIISKPDIIPAFETLNEFEADTDPRNLKQITRQPDLSITAPDLPDFSDVDVDNLKDEILDNISAGDHFRALLNKQEADFDQLCAILRTTPTKLAFMMKALQR